MLALEASRDAVRTAKSWQTGITVQTPIGGWSLVRIEYVECPSRYDRTNIVHASQTGSHEVWFSGVHYQMVPGGAWAAIDAPLPSECGAGPELVSSGTLYGDLDAIVRDGEVRPGKLAAALSEPAGCTWWDAASVKGEAANYSVCLDENDHLPRRLRTAEHGETYMYTFTKWNATTVTLPKDIVASGP